MEYQKLIISVTVVQSVISAFPLPALRPTGVNHSLVRHEAVITVKWMYDDLHENNAQS